jgi:hypothetical protein
MWLDGWTIGRRLCPGMAAHLLWWLALVDASRGFCFLPRLLDADHRLPQGASSDEAVNQLPQRCKWLSLVIIATSDIPGAQFSCLRLTATCTGISQRRRCPEKPSPHCIASWFRWMAQYLAPHSPNSSRERCCKGSAIRKRFWVFEVDRYSAVAGSFPLRTQDVRLQPFSATPSLLALHQPIQNLLVLN